ncbi:MAG TPA: hypothetical protein PLI96_11410 [Halothiobacillus sp.]|nr:hypothetical protein [Halothiobacillus sp.]
MANSKPFSLFLGEHRGGVLHDEISDALQEVVASVANEGKAGKLTLTITVKPANAGEGALAVTDDIKLTLPKETKSGSIFFVSPENNLIREDPRQRSLELREVHQHLPAREIA